VKVPVYLKTMASAYIGEVDIDSPEEFFDVAEALWKSQGYEYPTLCHQCSDVDLSDFEIDEAGLDFYFKKGGQ